jgi:DNA-binding LacI/PurR family transcriptional regulator
MEHKEVKDKSLAKRATLRDVANLAKVGTGSVSRYLNGDQSIKTVNRQKIEDAIKELNFVPNVTARKLAKGKSGNILLLMVSETPITMATWIYEKEIVQEIYSGLINSEYTLQLALCPADQTEIYKMIKKNIETRNADAVMILSNYCVEQECVVLLEKNNIPYILIGSKNYKRNVNEILIDNFSAMKIVMDYLESLKHKKIAFISGNQDQVQMAARIRSYFDLMREKGFEVYPNYIKYGEYSMDSGYNCTKELIQQNFNDLPTAIICSNDIIACGAIKALKEYNIKIPKEISITGFDNITSAEVIEPPLTTFKLPTGMGSMATQMLLKMMKEGKTNIVNDRQMKFEFIIRNSATLAREGD